MNKFDEQILVVKRNILFNNEKNNFNGFLLSDDARVKEIISTFGQYEVKRRGNMEEDPSYKQLIGYALIKDEKTKDVLVYKRLVGGGESRLHGKASVGVGGHMNEVENENIENIIKINMAREIEEEIGIPLETAIKNMAFAGLINDDSNEVGEVHLGLVYVCEVNKEQIKITEKDTLKISWHNSREAKEIENYESWSSFLTPIM